MTINRVYVSSIKYGQVEQGTQLMDREGLIIKMRGQIKTVEKEQNKAKNKKR